MNDRELGHIGIAGIVSVLIALFFFVVIMASGGCAAASPKPPKAEVQCAPSNYEKCADKCASQGRGAPFIVENSVDVACFCRKSGEGT